MLDNFYLKLDQSSKNLHKKIPLKIAQKIDFNVMSHFLELFYE